LESGGTSGQKPNKKKREKKKGVPFLFRTKKKKDWRGHFK
jgi:hypothetical protein